MSILSTVSLRRRRRRARALVTRSGRTVPTATAAFSARDEGHGCCLVVGLVDDARV